MTTMAHLTTLADRVALGSPVRAAVVPIHATHQRGTCGGGHTVPMPPYPVDRGRCGLQAPHKLTGNPQMTPNRITRGHREVPGHHGGTSWTGSFWHGFSQGSTHPATGAKGCLVGGLSPSLGDTGPWAGPGLQGWAVGRSCLGTPAKTLQSQAQPQQWGTHPAPTLVSFHCRWT